MNIVIRVDSSNIIGWGHIIRCSALAHRLKAANHNIIFVTQCCSKRLINLLELYVFKIISLPPSKVSSIEEAEIFNKIIKDLKLTINVVIIDHYNLDYHYQSQLRLMVDKIIVIDDLANRQHDCDLLIDQNYYHNAIDRYQNLVPKNSELLLGPEYALIRKHFLQYKKSRKIREGKVSNILIMFGGGNAFLPTYKALDACLKVKDSTMEINVVLNCEESETIEINKLQSKGSFNLFNNVRNMAVLMLQADLCIGAGGTSTWERCFLGLPGIVLTTATNQVESSSNLQSLGMIRYLGDAFKIEQAVIESELRQILSQPTLINQMSYRAYHLIDGLGCERITKKIEALI